MVDPNLVREESGIKFWKANDAVIPPHVYKDARAECPAAQKVAYEWHLEAFLHARMTQEKARSVDREMDEETSFDMRAAFGPGVEVVDVFTGRKSRT